MKRIDKDIFSFTLLEYKTVTISFFISIALAIICVSIKLYLINDILNAFEALSLSYIASYLLFILIQLLPSFKNYKKTFTIISPILQ